MCIVSIVLKFIFSFWAFYYLFITNDIPYYLCIFVCDCESLTRKSRHSLFSSRASCNCKNIYYEFGFLFQSNSNFTQHHSASGRDNPISHRRPSHPGRIKRSNAQYSRWTVRLSFSLSVWSSVRCSSPFCVLGHRLQQTVELLFLLRISVRRLYCALAGLCSILKSAGGIVIVPHER